LKRPYQLIAGLATAVPRPEQLPNGRPAYRFQIRPGILFHADPCFAPDQSGRRTREVTAADFAFALARIADPAVNSPVISRFADHAGGAGPFRLSLYEKQYRFTLERNELWYGSQPGGADAPGAVFPAQIDAEDIAEGRVDASYAGRRMPFVDRVKFYREREGI